MRTGKNNWGSGINRGKKHSFTLETVDREHGEMCSGLIGQDGAHSPRVLAHGPVCQPFAHERGPICMERGPAGGGSRTERWPKHGFVCKPVSYCLQAPTDRGLCALDSAAGHQPAPGSAVTKNGTGLPAGQSDRLQDRARARVPLSVSEMRRLFWCLVLATQQRVARMLAWSAWRRWH